MRGRHFLSLVATFAVALILVAVPAYADTGNGASGTGGTGGGSSGPPAQQGGGTGGNFTWWDVRNTKVGSLTWPGDLTLARDMTTFLNGTQNDGEKQLANDTLYQNGGTLLWTNACLTPGATKKGTACTGSGSYAQFGSEFHPKTATGGIAETGEPIAYNVMLWRAPQIAGAKLACVIESQKAHGDGSGCGLSNALQTSSLLWSRQIGLDGSPDDKAGTPSDWWWLGGANGALASSTAKYAGPIGADVNANHACDARFNADKHTPGTAAKLSNETNLGGSDCYWQLGGGESLWVSAKFDVPHAATKTQAAYYSASFHYAFSSPLPNQAYAIQITAVDNHEQLLNPAFATTEAGAIKPDAANYFRAFVPKPDVPTTGPSASMCKNIPTLTIMEAKSEGYYVTDGTCTLPPAGSDPIAPHVVLNADSPVPTRVWALADVQVQVPQDLGFDQAILPDIVKLTHFTPQTAYNGYRGLGNTYSTNYVMYDSFLGQLMPTVGPNGHSVYQALLEQPANLGVGGGAGLVLAQNDFRLSWLQPTVTNPCDASTVAAVTGDPLTGPWPIAPNVCKTASGATPRDAWDDTLAASADDEVRWVNGKASTTRQTFIKAQPLKCNDLAKMTWNTTDQRMESPAVSVSACNPWMTFTNFQGPEYTAQVANTTRLAEGYVNVNGGPLKKGTGAVGFELQLKGIDPSKIGTRSVWQRDTGDQVDVPGSPSQLNPVTGLPSMWFDKPGLPEGANLAIGTSAAAGDRLVKGTEENDAATDAKDGGTPTGGIGAGYTLKWGWTPSSTDYRVVDACSTSLGVPKDASFHSPSLDAPTGIDGLAPGVAQKALSRGDYAATPAFPANDDWRSLLREPDLASGGKIVATVPYDGKRPGNTAGEEPGKVGYPTNTNCQKTVTSGDQAASYAHGTWYESSSYTVETPGAPVDVCAYWIVPGVICGGWVQAPTTTKTTYHVYSFKPTGSVYPTTAAAQAITRTPNKPGGDPLVANAHSSLVSDWSNAPSGATIVIDSGSTSAPGWASITTRGYVQTGTWAYGREAGPGWGKGQTGPRIPNGPYMAAFTLAGLSSSDLRGSYALRSSYDGFNWAWMSREIESAPEGDGVQAVAVYGTRDSG